MAGNKRVLSSLKNGPARRNLFGPVDREQLQRDYQAALRKDLEEASSRWSFDFIRDQPLDNGDFQWEGVPDAKVPLLYRSCVPDVELPGRPVVVEVAAAAAAEASKPREAKIDLVQSENESENEKENNVPCSPRRRAVHRLKLEKTPEKEERGGLKRKQTNITGTEPRAESMGTNNLSNKELRLKK